MLPTSEYLSRLVLVKGGASGVEGDRCSIQELRSWKGLDPKEWSIPEDTSGVIAFFITVMQDSLDEFRAKMPHLLPFLYACKRGSNLLEKARMFRLVDWLIRDVLILMVPDNMGLNGLPPIVSRETALIANRLVAQITGEDLINPNFWRATQYAAEGVTEQAAAISARAAADAVLRLEKSSRAFPDPIAMIHELILMKE